MSQLIINYLELAIGPELLYPYSAKIFEGQNFADGSETFRRNKFCGPRIGRKHFANLIFAVRNKSVEIAKKLCTSKVGTTQYEMEWRPRWL